MQVFVCNCDFLAHRMFSEKLLSFNLWNKIFHFGKVNTTVHLSGGWKQALQQRAKAKSKLRCEACKQWLKYYRLSMGRQRKQKTVWWEWTKGAYQLRKSPKKSLQQGAISPIWCLSCPEVRPFFFSIWFYPVRSNKNVSTISFSFRWGFWEFFHRIYQEK